MSKQMTVYATHYSAAGRPDFIGEVLDYTDGILTVQEPDAKALRLFGQWIPFIRVMEMAGSECRVFINPLECFRSWPEADNISATDIPGLQKSKRF
jgi:hypothetical protein